MVLESQEMSQHLTADRERMTLTVLVDRELRERLERAAAVNERSLGAEVRHLLRRHLTDLHEGGLLMSNDLFGDWTTPPEGVAYGRRLDSGWPEGTLAVLEVEWAATPERVARARELFEEARFSDLEPRGSKGRRWLHRESGIEYVSDESQVLGEVDPSSTGVKYFVVNGGRIFFLKDRRHEARDGVQAPAYRPTSAGHRRFQAPRRRWPERGPRSAGPGARAQSRRNTRERRCGPVGVLPPARGSSPQTVNYYTTCREDFGSLSAFDGPVPGHFSAEAA